MNDFNVISITNTPPTHTHTHVLLWCDLLPLSRLLNANKINCIRADAFADLQNLSLLSLYDNKIQTLVKGTFATLRAIQTL